MSRVLVWLIFIVFISSCQDLRHLPECEECSECPEATDDQEETEGDESPNILDQDIPENDDVEVEDSAEVKENTYTDIEGVWETVESSLVQEPTTCGPVIIQGTKMRSMRKIAINGDNEIALYQCDTSEPDCGTPLYKIGDFVWENDMVSGAGEFVERFSFYIRSEVLVNEIEFTSNNRAKAYNKIHVSFWADEEFTKPYTVDGKKECDHEVNYDMNKL